MKITDKDKDRPQKEKIIELLSSPESWELGLAILRSEIPAASPEDVRYYTGEIKKLTLLMQERIR